MVSRAVCCFLSELCLLGKGTDMGGRRQIVERELNDIRRFRDEVLEKHKTGQILVWMYYHAISPPAVLLLRTSSRLRKFLDQKARPLLAKKCRVWISGYRRNAR